MRHAAGDGGAPRRATQHRRNQGGDGCLERIRELLSRCGGDFLVLSGEDHLSLETMLAGGHGVISVTANVAPAAMREMCSLALRGDEEGARVVDARLRNLHAALFFESNPIPVKWALHDMGLIPPGIRLPLTPLSASLHERVPGSPAGHDDSAGLKARADPANGSSRGRHDAPVPRASRTSPCRLAAVRSNWNHRNRSSMTQNTECSVP